MPLEDGYQVEKYLEAISFTIAEAITGYIKDDTPPDAPVEKDFLKFCLFLVDRKTGAVKYISDIKDNLAVIEMLKRVISQRTAREITQDMREVKAEDVTPKDKDEKETIN